jgi:hypothetical protein
MSILGLPVLPTTMMSDDKTNVLAARNNAIKHIHIVLRFFSSLPLLSIFQQMNNLDSRKAKPKWLLLSFWHGTLIFTYLVFIFAGFGNILQVSWRPDD